MTRISLRSIRATVLIQPEFPLALAEGAQAQRVELDEARGIAMIVGDRAFLEGDEILIVQRISAFAADHDDVALVELEANPASDVLLAEIDRRLQHLALGREPETIVDEFSIFRHQPVLEMRRTAVERDRFDAAMRGQQNGPAGRLVHAAR